MREEKELMFLRHISYHAVYDPSVYDALLYAAKSGFSGIQVADETPHLSLYELCSGQFDAMKKVASELGVYITLHASDASASLFQTNRYLLSGIREYYTELFACADRIAARLVTIHPGAPSCFHTDSIPEYEFPEEDIFLYREVFQENIEFLLSVNKGKVPICIENFNLATETLDMLYPYLERGDLFLCWDIAKSYHDADMERFFFDRLSWVKQVHLHDVRKRDDGRYRSHCVIGTGEIDFMPYLNCLSAADVMDYCIEVRPREKAKESLDHLASLQ